MAAGLAATEAANDQHAAQARLEQSKAGVNSALSKRFGITPKPVTPAMQKFSTYDQAPTDVKGSVGPAAGTGAGGASTSGATGMASPFATGPNGTVRYAFNTNAGWAGLKDTNYGFIVAEGKNNWGFDAAPNHWHQPGFLFGYTEGSATSGHVQKCLMVSDPTNNLASANNAPSQDCTYGVELRMPDFALSWNGNRSPGNCDNGQCDGDYATIDAQKCPWGTPMYTNNTQPWKADGSGERGTSLRTLGGGQVVYWRYITKDYRHVMVNVHNLGSSQQNWGFIWSDCISNYGPNVTAPDPSI